MMGVATRFVVIAFLALGALQAPARQLPAYRAPRFPGTQVPDLNGIWQAVNSANWDIEPHAAGPSPFPALLGALGAMPAGAGRGRGRKDPLSAVGRREEKREFCKAAHPSNDDCAQRHNGRPRSEVLSARRSSRDLHRSCPSRLFKPQNKSCSLTNLPALRGSCIWIANRSLRQIHGWAGLSEVGMATRWSLT